MKKINAKKILIVALAIAIVFATTGCAAIKSWFSRTKEQLVGNNFTITTYDHYGNATLKLSGTKVHVGLLENNANFNSESTGFESEVLEFTINGDEVYQIGDTAVIAEEGLDMITDFSIDHDIEVENGGGFMPFDRCVNDYANLVGKAKVVLISSQMGIPIGVYQGDSVYVEVPEDLPKMTLLNIDGKALYISRANYTIIDSALLKESN